MISGKKIPLGDREFTVPPANFGTLLAFDEMKKTYQPGDTEYTLGMIDFIHSTIKRNHPDVTREFMLEHLDPRTMKEAFDAIAESAGMTSGEAQAGN